MLLKVTEIRQKKLVVSKLNYDFITKTNNSLKYQIFNSKIEFKTWQDKGRHSFSSLYIHIYIFLSTTYLSDLKPRCTIIRYKCYNLKNPHVIITCKLLGYYISHLFNYIVPIQNKFAAKTFIYSTPYRFSVRPQSLCLIFIQRLYNYLPALRVTFNSRIIHNIYNQL